MGIDVTFQLDEEANEETIHFFPYKEMTREEAKQTADMKKVCVFCGEEMKEIVFLGYYKGNALTFHQILCGNCDSTAFIYKKAE